jgi:hypothetical protein
MRDRIVNGANLIISVPAKQGVEYPAAYPHPVLTDNNRRGCIRSIVLPAPARAAGHVRSKQGFLPPVDAPSGPQAIASQEGFIDPDERLMQRHKLPADL